MSAQRRCAVASAALLVLAGCASTPGPGEIIVEGAASVESVVPTLASSSLSPVSSAAARASASPEPDQLFPTAAFATIPEVPVSETAAAAYQTALAAMADGAGMAATVLTAGGTWSGATGLADGVRAVTVDDQFAIASITKSVVAAQVMQMVESGEVRLDDPAIVHLPANFAFDTNGATIRELLGHRSGIPNYYPAVVGTLRADPHHFWTPDELLAMVPPDRAPVGELFEYTDTNYLLLGLVIEHVRGRPLADVLRHGVLDISGLERLIYQPAEVPTEPMAMPDGASAATLASGGGYLPSLAGSTSDGPAAAMASDAPSLARWWRAFCAGEIVSRASLTEMATFRDGYGLGLYDPYGGAVGHTGEHLGYVAWAGCLPDDGAVIVVLSNGVVEDIGAMAAPLFIALRSDSVHP